MADAIQATNDYLFRFSFVLCRSVFLMSKTMNSNDFHSWLFYDILLFDWIELYSVIVSLWSWNLQKRLEMKSPM